MDRNINTLDLGDFQKFACADRKTMCDLLAAVRILEENIRYADFKKNDTDADFELYSKVCAYLKEDLKVVTATIAGSLAGRISAQMEPLDEKKE